MRNSGRKGHTIKGQESWGFPNLGKRKLKAGMTASEIS